MNIIVYLVR